MNSLPDMIWIELRKAFRSRMPLFTALGFLFIPLVCAFLIFIYKNPELSRKIGLVSAKANLLVGGSDWPAYLKLVNQALTAGGFFLFCLIIAWEFGREFTDGTVKDLLAVPVPRLSILLAKFFLVAVWAILLTLLVYISSMIIGALIRLSNGSPDVILQAGGLQALSSISMILVILPFAFFASAGRGYLLPLGLAILTLITANLAVIAGYGEYFPWSIPGLIGQDFSVPPISYVIVALTGLAGILATYAWWMTADQSS